MKTIKTEAIILRRTNYGEADRILQILTPDHGKLSVMARGVRKERSKLAGGIELFAVSHVTLHKGKGELEILTSARLDTFFAHILDDYDRMQFGYEVLKRAGNAASMVPEPEWYELTKTALVSLQETSIPVALTELWFRLHYANLLGQGLNVLTEANGQKLMAEKLYRYNAQEMGLFEHPAGPLTSEHIKLLRLASARPPLILRQIGGIEAILSDCLWVARQHAS